MSMDEHSRAGDTPITEQEGVMFGATPVWERGRKRRGAGRKSAAPATTTAATVSPEPRTFAAERHYDEPMALDRPVSRPDQTTAYALGAASATPSTLAAEDPDGGLVAPIGRTSGRPAVQSKSRSIAPVAVAAGAVGLVALGAAGWFASRDSQGVPELTPGAATSEVATASALPPATADPTLTNQNVLPQRAPAANAPAPVATPAETPRQMARAERRATTPAPRTRPAVAGADASGVNASATAVLPSGPQPYSAVNPSAAPTTVNPATPPAQAGPAPIPSTPPTITPEPTPTPAPEAATSPTTEAAPQ